MGLKYHSNINYALVSDLLRQAIIKTENHLMFFSDSSWQYCPDTGRSTGAYIIFYQSGTIEHGTHVIGPFDWSSTESEYNAEFTIGTTLAHFRILIHEILNKDPDIVPEETPIIILDSKSATCMAKNGTDTKHTSHITRRVHFVSNWENWKCTRLTGQREVCNWKTFPLRMLVSVI